MASLQNRSTSAEARWRVRWQDGRGAPVRSYTFTSPVVSRGRSDAESAGRRLKAYVDLMGHQLTVVDALVGAGYRVEGFTSDQDVVAPVTVAEYAERWLATLGRANGRSRGDYARIVKEHVAPFLGDIAVEALTVEQVAAWLRDQEVSTTGRGLHDSSKAPSPKTIANRHGVLSAMLTAAERAGIRRGNPAKGLGPTVGSMHREMCFLTHSEWRILTGAFASLQGDQRRRVVDRTFAGDMATTLVGTGLRWSELTALSTAQCQLTGARPLLLIDRAWKRQPDGSYLVGAPKSARSVRGVEVPDAVRDLLLGRTRGKHPDDLVFTAPHGTAYRSSWFYHRHWRPAVDRAIEAGLGKRPRVHDLRHTHAAWLIADGRPLASIQRRLGHESITTTIDRYGHLMPELDAGNAAAIDRALAPVVSDPASPIAQTL